MKKKSDLVHHDEKAAEPERSSLSSTSAHTPTPWTADDDANVRADGDIVAWVTSPDSFREGDKPSMANAVFIVRACNAYDEMREALSDIVKSIDENPSYTPSSEAFLRARAVLAKVKS